MKDIQDLRIEYRESLGEYWLRLSKVSAVVAMALVPAGVTLDYAVYPDQIELFALLRLLCAIVILSLFLTYFTGPGKRWFREITFIWLLSVQAMICWMIYVTEGALSPYYAGLNLAVLGVGLILPTNAYETVFFSVLTFILYIASVMPLDVHDAGVRVVYNNIYFLLLTFIITSIASFFMDQRRFEEFRLKYELGERNKKLAEIDKMKSEFFANISHELRTPLTLILSPIQDVLESSSTLSEGLASALGTARNNALRLLKLVNDLLDVIRLEEGRSELLRTPIAIDPIVAGIADSMAYLARLQGIDLRIGLKAKGQVVLGDVAALEKVFINIMNNAVKFCDEGGTVEVTSQVKKNKVEIVIEDSGIGISSKDLPFIFDRFRQADGSSTRRYQGTGLGLALAKEIVERHFGIINVCSEVGRGTRMSVELPLSQPGDEERGSEYVDEPLSIGLQRLHRVAAINTGLVIDYDDPVEQDEDGDQLSNRSGSVLVVDDEPDMRRYLASMLADDYRVSLADNGADGLRIACKDRPDLVVLDLMLPEIDGLEVCRKLKSREETRGIKIVLLTARVDEEAKLTALQNGADDFITKPFSRVEVRSRLANLYETARLERDLGKRNEELINALADLKTAQAQLIQSEKLNALGGLAAGLLHEVNNPLNYSLTALQLVQAEPIVKENELLGEVCADINEGMQRIREIVSDLRAFAYPSEADKRSPFFFRDALESALRFTSHELKGIKVLLDLPDVDKVIGSKNHITQILVNLLLNSAKAIKEMHGGVGGEIRVEGIIREERLEVSVSDNGVGMDDETLARVFDPFFTTRDVGEGMGLGLSICYTIVANHGGRLVAHGKPGEGAKMVFDLPRADPASAEVS